MAATTIQTFLGSGTHADRPVTPDIAAGIIAIYRETDTGKDFVWDGATWNEMGNPLPDLPAGHLLGNATGSSAAATDTALSDLIDEAIGSTRGSVVIRGASGWALLTPGTDGFVLTAHGTGADPDWAAGGGGGGGSGNISDVHEAGNWGNVNDYTVGAVVNDGGHRWLNISAIVTSTTTADHWNPADETNMAVTTTANTDDTATVVSTASAFIRSTLFQTTGKWYVEFGGYYLLQNGTGPGIMDSAGNSIIYTAIGSHGLGNVPACLAVDVDAKLVWARQTTTSNWNGNPSADPATGVGGIDFSGFSAISGGVALAFVAGGATEKVVLNSGGTSFGGAVPAGYHSGWLGTIPNTAPNLDGTHWVKLSIDTGGALPTIADGSLIGNATGGSAAAAETTLTDLIDHALGNTRGGVLCRYATAWEVLPPGTAGQFLQTAGTGADTIWANAPGLPSIANGNLLGNASGGAHAAQETTLSDLIDTAAGNAQGDVIYRSASGWTALPPGTAGEVLQTGGASANPSWLALGSMASQSAGAVTITGGSITGMSAPSADSDVAIFRNVTGSRWKQAVGAATTAALPSCTYANGTAGVGATLTAAANGALPSIDGATSLVGNVYLIKNQAAGLQNGIYTLAQLGDASNPWILTRVSWYDEGSGASAFTNEISVGDVIPVASGTVNANTAWMQTAQGTIIVGTTGLNYIVLGPASTQSLLDGIGNTQGDILYRGASGWSALAPGASGQALKTQGSSANPIWGDVLAISLASLADKDILVYDSASSQWKNQRPKYVIGAFAPGTLSGSQKILYHSFAKAVTFPANFGAYLGLASEAGGSANATASTAINVDKASSGTPNTFSNVGTITIASSSVTPTFATSGGAAVSFAQGDILRIVGPASADATFADFYATLVGYET